MLRVTALDDASPDLPKCLIEKSMQRLNYGVAIGPFCWRQQTKLDQNLDFAVAHLGSVAANAARQLG